MPMRKLQLKPGVDVEETPTLNAAQVSASCLIRYYAGLVQKRGGWQAFTATPIIGLGSGLHGWSDTSGATYLAVGTDQRLEVTIGGDLNDITPLATTTNPAVAFTTTATSSEVEIEDAGYQPSVGDWLNLVTQVSVGGIVPFGLYRVIESVDATHYKVDVGTPATSSVSAGGAVPLYSTTNTSAVVNVTLANHGYADGDVFEALVSTTVATVVISGPYSVTFIDADHFSITASSAANATTTGSENAGNARIEYLLPSGLTEDTPESGYGLGDYGLGDYGLGNSSAIVPMRQWALDNFGQDLIASPTDGAIYYWQPATVQPVSVVSIDAPLYSTWVFVMSQARIVVALGAETGGTQEPLLVRWSDSDDFTAWTPTASNEAGSFPIPQGSRLIGGVSTGLGALLWTDIGLYSMVYQGFPLIFSFRPVAIGCGLMNARAVATVGSLVFWLSNHGFFRMSLGDSAPTQMECSVWDVLVNNWNLSQPGQFVMGSNSLTNEFELFFPLDPSSEFYVAGSINRGSVKWNYIEGAWDYTFSSQLQRTAWEGHSAIGNPVGTDLNSIIQQHEIGFDANGAAMVWSWTTGYFDMSEGEDIVFVDWIIPDFVTLGNPTISIELLAQQYPNQDPTVVGPFYVQPTTWFVPPFGFRARQMAIRVSGSDIGTFNRLGALRYRFAPDGRGPT